MNNRELLLTAMRRGLPERIPYTYGAEREADAQLRQHLRLDEKVSIADHFGCNSFGSVWSAIGKGPSMPEREARMARLPVAPGGRIDMWGIKREWVQAGTVRYMEITGAPLANVETIADVEAYDWPRPEDVVWPEMPPDLDLRAWKEAQATVVVDGSYLCPFGIPWAMLGMEKMMVELVGNPGLVEAVVAKVEEFTLTCLRTLLTRYPGGVDVISCGDDYGSQDRLLLSPGMIGGFFMPSLKRHFDLGKEHGTLCYHHCCGAIFDMIPLFIEAGLDVLNPVQTSATGMEPARLKAAFGAHLAFHGGMDIQQTLRTGTPASVREEVRQRIGTLGPNGYILAPSHLLQPDIPPANIVAMYDEVRAWRP